MAMKDLWLKYHAIREKWSGDSLETFAKQSAAKVTAPETHREGGTMPFYEITEEPTAYWYDDDEPTENIRWPEDMSDDGFAELYLRAEEVWPNGASIRDAFLADDRFGDEHPDDVHTRFDD